MRTPAFVATAAGILAGITAFAQGPVYSVNIVGFQKVTTAPGSFNLSGNPFLKSAMTVQDVVGNQGTGGDSFGNADNLLLWTGSAYKQLFLVGQGIDPELDGKWVDENFTPSTDVVAPGTGFWIKSSAVTNTTTIVGDVVMDATKSFTINPGFNLLSYPYSTTAAINSSQMGLNAAAGCTGGDSFETADNIYVWNGAQYVQYFLVAIGTDPELDDKWVDENFTPTTVSVQPGQGLWYKRTGSSSFTWTTTKPY
jgi:hypothetical protein